MAGHSNPEEAVPKVASDTSAIITPKIRHAVSARSNADAASPFSAALDEAAQAQPPADRSVKRSERRAEAEAPVSKTARRPADQKTAESPRDPQRGEQPAEAKTTDDKSEVAETQTTDKGEPTEAAQVETTDAASPEGAADAQIAALAAQVAVVAAPAPAQNIQTDAELTLAPEAVTQAVTQVNVKADAETAAVTVEPSNTEAVEAKPIVEKAPQLDDNELVAAAVTAPLTEKSVAKGSVPSVPQVKATSAQKSQTKSALVSSEAADAELAASEQADTAAAEKPEGKAPLPRLSELVAMVREGARGERFEITRSTDAQAPAPSTVEPVNAPAQQMPAIQAAANVSQVPAAQAQTTSHGTPLQGVAVEIAAQALSGKHRFEIRLDPPELGRIHVRLDVDRDGQVLSRLVVDRVDTLDLLRRDAANLERALNDAGLKTSDHGLQFSLRDQNGQSRDDAPARDSAALVASDELTATLETQRGYRRTASVAGGIDIRV
ncbi:MAG: flagellar hook-length control protein FliK [Pseudolabrys sp.]|nr:flagellar hook-length control protein FliK [Pseudolabrys sp.]